MIKNERQYKITKTQADRFRVTLERLPTSGHGTSLLESAQRNALASQLAELDEQVRQYEMLKSGGVRVFEIQQLEDLPRALIRARISQGLTQSDLAGRLGIHEQQIQQYEANEYSNASFSRMRQVAEALGVMVANDVFVPDDLTGGGLKKKLLAIGFDQNFIDSRLLPVSTRGRLGSLDSASEVMRSARFAARALDLKVSSLLTDGVPETGLRSAAGVRHKLSKNADARKVGLYTVYAHYLGLLAIQATGHLRQSPTPDDTDELHDGILSAYGEVTFRSALKFVWDNLGIPVLPLKLHGGFHGATWRIRGVNVIVLNPSQTFPAFWLNDLLHELGHTSQDPEDAERSVIEEEPTWEARDKSPEEKDARMFAADTTFRSRGNDLARMCESAAGSIEGLKGAVERVAAAEGVQVDSLALHMAARIKSSSWWGTAMNLQDRSQDSFEIARSEFLGRIDLTRLSPDDREMLLSGLQGDGE